MRRLAGRTVAMVLTVGIAIAGGSAHSQTNRDPLAEEIFRELVEIRSSAAYPENTRRLLQGVAERLSRAGFGDEDIVVVEAGGANLVVRLRGSGTRRPLLAMAHVDVVDADPASWQADPFTLAEADGYFYGRGTSDNKAGATALIVNFIRLRREAYRPDRDLIMVLTGNEESTMEGISHLAMERRDLIDAELAFNTDAGGGVLDANGEPSLFSVQMAEKRYQTFELVATNPGGHSSLPRPDNAIYELSHALVRLQQHRFPVHVSDIAREGFRVLGERMPGEAGELLRAAGRENADPDALRRLAATSPGANSTMRTTCVATMLDAGVAENALPRTARATVNCRILPGVDPQRVMATLREVVNDDRIAIDMVKSGGQVASPSSPLRADILKPVRELVDEMWPGAVIAPEQATYATDGLWVRKAGIPVYGVSGVFADEGLMFGAHGLDERVRVDSFHDAVEFWYRLLKRFSS